MYKIIGIDPGNNLGTSILTIDSNNSIVDIDSRTYSLDIDNKLLSLREIVTDIYLTNRPILVCVETVFMHRFPKAVIMLSQFIACIDITLKELNRDVKILWYAPKYIKSMVCNGDANKDDMRTTINNIEEITSIVSKDNIERWTEHSIDATMIAYTGLLDVRIFPYLLL